jgi:hypothetical protein
MENQYKLAQEILQKTGINIVSCGNCGAILLHRAGVEVLNCLYCEIGETDICDNPDLFVDDNN